MDNPADNIQDLQVFEFGGVNPSISDSSTYTFLSAKTMFDTLKEIWKAVTCTHVTSPSNLYLDKALAMEGTETANVSASGMGAITPTLLHVERVIILFRVEPFTAEPMLS
jgi:methionine-gamma-lyase